MGAEGSCRVGRVGRVFEKRTRDSFHPWPIDAEELQPYKSDGLTTLDTSPLLPVPYI